MSKIEVSSMSPVTQGFTGLILIEDFLEPCILEGKGGAQGGQKINAVDVANHMIDHQDITEIPSAPSPPIEHCHIQETAKLVCFDFETTSLAAFHSFDQSALCKLNITFDNQLNLPTLLEFVDNKVLSIGMARKIAASNLNKASLLIAFSRGQENGLQQLFSEECGKGPRVTRSSKIFHVVSKLELAAKDAGKEVNMAKKCDLFMLNLYLFYSSTQEETVDIEENLYAEEAEKQEEMKEDFVREKCKLQKRLPGKDGQMLK
ncbi:Hypothetical predicted protein [Mytilus galloprovincialis]|uniref:PML C-terminal domain-containing protein n=1 Tax=Mytilus galloprovincialis TaxID=29158 RepID=A0A8B6H4D0_MYTGA|nr:Hypothetical predicted protein [Mytilus galloprovincialis]